MRHGRDFPIAVMTDCFYSFVLNVMFKEFSINSSHFILTFACVV